MGCKQSKAKVLRVPASKAVLKGGAIPAHVAYATQPTKSSVGAEGKSTVPLRKITQEQFFRANTVEQVAAGIASGLGLLVKRDERTLLHRLCAIGEVGPARLILSAAQEHGILPQLLATTDGRDYRPIHVAATAGEVGCVELLLQFGECVDVPTSKEKWTPLTIACKAGLASMARCLLEGGADVERTDGRKWTPMKNAITISGSGPTVQTLLEFGASPTMAWAGAPTTIYEFLHLTGRVHVVPYVLAGEAIRGRAAGSDARGGLVHGDWAITEEGSIAAVAPFTTPCGHDHSSTLHHLVSAFLYGDDEAPAVVGDVPIDDEPLPYELPLYPGTGTEPQKRKPRRRRNRGRRVPLAVTEQSTGVEQPAGAEQSAGTEEPGGRRSPVLHSEPTPAAARVPFAAVAARADPSANVPALPKPVPRRPPASYADAVRSR